MNAQPAQARVTTAAARTSVLVIDDDSSTRRLVTSILRGGGYEVLAASSGEQALAMIKSTPAILVAISDIDMPEMDGIRFLRYLGSTTLPACAPRVMFLTAHPSMEFAVEAMRLGAVDFLAKPVRAQALLKALHDAIERAQRDRAILLPAQAASLAQQADALAAALRCMTPAPASAASGAAGAIRAAAGSESEFSLLNHVRRPRSLAGLGELDDVAWELLLELLRAEKSGQRLSVSALGISIEASFTTAFRRIKELVKAGQIMRHPDPMDARRDFVALSPESRAVLEGYLEHVARELAAGAPSR